MDLDLNPTSEHGPNQSVRLLSLIRIAGACYDPTYSSLKDLQSARKQ